MQKMCSLTKHTREISANSINTWRQANWLKDLQAVKHPQSKVETVVPRNREWTKSASWLKYVSLMNPNNLKSVTFVTSKLVMKVTISSLQRGLSTIYLVICLTRKLLLGIQISKKNKISSQARLPVLSSKMMMKKRRSNKRTTNEMQWSLKSSSRNISGNKQMWVQRLKV